MSGEISSLEEMERRTSLLLRALSPALGAAYLYPPPPFRYTGQRDVQPGDPVAMRAVREHRRYSRALLAHLTTEASHDIEENFAAHRDLVPHKGSFNFRKLIPGLSRAAPDGGGALTPGEVTLASFRCNAKLPGDLMPTPARCFATSRAVIVRTTATNTTTRIQLTRIDAVLRRDGGRGGIALLLLPLLPGVDRPEVLLGSLECADAAAALFDELVVLAKGRRGESEQRRHSAETTVEDSASGVPTCAGPVTTPASAAHHKSNANDDGNSNAADEGEDDALSSPSLQRRDSHGGSPHHVLTAEAYENQRYYLVAGWSAHLLPGERPPWSSRCGTQRRPIVDERGRDPPVGWEWAEAWHLEVRPDEVGLPDDSDGWLYASSFGSDSWAGTRRWDDVVRRRRWARLCVRAEDN